MVGVGAAYVYLLGTLDCALRLGYWVNNVVYILAYLIRRHLAQAHVALARSSFFRPPARSLTRKQKVGWTRAPAPQQVR